MRDVTLRNGGNALPKGCPRLCMNGGCGTLQRNRGYRPKADMSGCIIPDMDARTMHTDTRTTDYEIHQ